MKTVFPYLLQEDSIMKKLATPPAGVARLAAISRYLRAVEGGGGKEVEEKEEKEEGKRWIPGCSGLIAESRTGGQQQQQPQQCVRRLPPRPCVTSDPTVRRCEPPPSRPPPPSRTVSTSISIIKLVVAPSRLASLTHSLRSPSFRVILPSPLSGRDDETCRRTRSGHVPPGGDSRSCDAAVCFLAER